MDSDEAEEWDGEDQPDGDAAAADELFKCADFTALFDFFVRLDMAIFRNSAIGCKAITMEEGIHLVGMSLQGPQVHNPALLQLAIAPGTVQAFSALSDTVRKMGPNYVAQHEQMLCILAKWSEAREDFGGCSEGGGGVAAAGNAGANGGMPSRREEVYETTRRFPSGYVEYEVRKCRQVSGPLALEPLREAMPESGPPPSLILSKQDLSACILYTVDNDSRLPRADATPTVGTPLPLGPPPMNSNVMVVSGSRAGAERGAAAAGVAGANDRGDRSSAAAYGYPDSNTDVHRLLDDRASLSTVAADGSAKGVQQPRSQSATFPGNSGESSGNNVPSKDTRSHPALLADRYPSTTGGERLRSQTAPVPNAASPRLTSTFAQHSSNASSLLLAHPASQPAPQAAFKSAKDDDVMAKDDDVMANLAAMQDQLTGLGVNSGKRTESGPVASVLRDCGQAHRQGANRYWSDVSSLSSPDPYIAPVSDGLGAAPPAVARTRHSGLQPTVPAASLCLPSQGLGPVHQFRRSDSIELHQADLNNVPPAIYCDYEVHCQPFVPIEGTEVTYLISRPSGQAISGSDIVHGSEWKVAFYIRNSTKPFHLVRATNVCPNALVFRIPPSPTGRYLEAFLQPHWFGPAAGGGRAHQPIIRSLRQLAIIYKYASV